MDHIRYHKRVYSLNDRIKEFKNESRKNRTRSIEKSKDAKENLTNSKINLRLSKRFDKLENELKYLKRTTPTPITKNKSQSLDILNDNKNNIKRNKKKNIFFAENKKNKKNYNFSGSLTIKNFNLKKFTPSYSTKNLISSIHLSPMKNQKSIYQFTSDEINELIAKNLKKKISFKKRKFKSKFLFL